MPREQIIVQSNQLFIGSSLADLALERPDEPLIFCGNEWISRAAFYDEVKIRIAILKTIVPLKPKVAIDLSEPLEFLFWFFSVCLLGGEVHVIAPEWPISMKSGVIKKSGPDLIIDEVKSRDLKAAAETSLSWEDHQPFADIDPESVFYVGFTSGSTSIPKGYRRTHQSWLKSFEAEALEFGPRIKSVTTTFSPLSHSLGLYASVRTIQNGSKLVLLSKFDPKRAISAISSAQANICYAAPSHLKLIEQVETHPIRSMQLVLTSGAKWIGSQKSLSEIFPEAEFAEFYGTSELSFVSVRRGNDKAPKNSVGRAFPGVEISIHDENGSVAPIGMKGRIFVQSDLLFEGYLSEDANLYRNGGAISVGDIGWLDQNGYLFLEGRENRMIVSAGKNVFPEMLEACLLQHSSIEQALVIGVLHQVRGEVIVALVIPKNNHNLCVRDLRDHLAMTVPQANLPKCFAQPFQWKWTRSGKTDVSALMKDFQENRCRYLR